MLPRTPETTFDFADGELVCVARLDTREAIDGVLFLYSTDGAYTFERAAMRPRPGDAGEWEAVVPAEGDSLAAFVEVTYREHTERYHMTSVPYLSEEFVPKIRPVPEF